MSDVSDVGDVGDVARTYGTALQGGPGSAVQPVVHLVSLLEERIASLVDRLDETSIRTIDKQPESL